MPSLELVPYERAGAFKAAAAADHVSISETGGTLWFVYEVDGVDVGVCALMHVRGGGRLKGAWVKPDQRGKGYGTAMTMERIRYATEELLMMRLETLSLHPDFFEAMGWKRVAAPRPNGAVMLAKSF